MSGFQALKRNRQTQLATLTQELEKSQQSSNYEDNRIWKVTRDKSGTGSAIIRFLPPSDGENTPWVRIFSHGFQGQGGWYIENSLTTTNDKDPVSEFNTSLWNNGTEAGKDQARKQKRRLNYYSNIYVIDDPANPENNGKVFLFKYGKKIHEKITDSMSPEFADEEPVNPFDLWEGCNFRLKIRMLDGWPNYDRSEFDNPAALFDNDEKLEEIWNSQYKLQELIAPDQFKPYDELKSKLDRILGLNGTPTVNQDEEDTPFYPDESKSETAEASADTLSYFEELTKQ
tara:strand:+ start:2136 stop:2993 length:858 start_codon:yes stop_codon:yes gene_type:complete